MRPPRIAGRRVRCSICKRRTVKDEVFGVWTCGQCARALHIGFMMGYEEGGDE